MKSPADIGLLVIVNGAFPVLVNVLNRTGLVTPTLRLPKLMLVGFSVRMPAAAFTVTVALADLVASATLLALTLTVVFALTVGALIHDCAKAEGATLKTNRRGTDTKRTRINLHMAQYRNVHNQKSEGEALHPFRKDLSKSCNSIIGHAERCATQDVLVIWTKTLLRPALQSKSFDIEATSVIENWRGFADAGSPIRLDCGPIESEWRESGSQF